VDRAVRAAGADLAHLEREDEVARALAKAEPLVEAERVGGRVDEEVGGAAGAQVLDHGLDERAADAVAPSRLGDVEVADPAVVLLEPRADEADGRPVLLRQEERVRVERAAELGLVRLPARVRPRGRGRPLRLPALPERAQRLEVVLGGVPDGHSGGWRRRPVRR
jgi:hypothetical protein